MKAALHKFVRTPFVRDAAILQSGTFVTMGFQAVASIIIARVLGPQQLGLYAITLAIVATVGLLTNLGQNKGLVTLLSEAYGKESKEGVLKALTYHVQVTLWWTVPMIILCLLATPIILHIFYPEHPIGLWVILGLCTLFALPAYDLFTVTLQSRRDIKKLTVVELVFAILEAGLPLLLLFLWEFSVTALMTGRLISAIGKGGCSLAWWRWLLKHDSLLPRARELIKAAMTRLHRKEIKLGLWIAADSHINTLTVQTPIYLLGIFGSAAMVGQYRVLMSYVVLSTQLSGSVGKLMNSVLPHLYTRNFAAFHRSFWKGNIGNLLLTYVILIPLLILGNTGIGVLFGDQYSLPPVVFLIISLWGLNGLTVGFGTYYRIHRALHLILWLQAVSVFAGLAMWYVLYRMGVNVLVTTVAYVITHSTVGKLCHIVNFRIMHHYDEQVLHTDS